MLMQCFAKQLGREYDLKRTFKSPEMSWSPLRSTRRERAAVQETVWRIIQYLRAVQRH